MLESLKGSLCTLIQNQIIMQTQSLAFNYYSACIKIKLVQNADLNGHCTLVASIFT